MSAAAAHAPQHDPSSIVFRLSDPERELRAVRLLQELERPRRGPAFAYSEADGAWQLAFPRHPVARLEYQFEVERADGASAVICDPANPRRAGGPFGERSVLELEGYEAPAWVARPAPPGESTAGMLPSRILGTELPLVLWRSA